MNVARRLTVPAKPGGACVAVVLAMASPALAQSTAGTVDSTALGVQRAALRVGASVRSPSGDNVGRVEHVLTGPDGLVRQVLVRTGGVARVRSSLKALPAAGLTSRGADLAASVTQEELLALPDVEAPSSSEPSNSGD